MRAARSRRNLDGRLFFPIAILACCCWSVALAEDKRPTEWVFKPTVRQVIHQYEHDLFWVGHLDSQGMFVPDPKIPPLRWASPEWDKWRKLEIYNNQKGAMVESVYEYHSGELIPGVLEAGLWFVPFRDEKVIGMDEYLERVKAGKARLRIYNLPGEIVKKSDKDKPEKK